MKAEFTLKNYVTTLVRLVFLVVFCLSMTSCLDENSFSPENGDYAPEDVSCKFFTFYKEDQNQWSFKVLFSEEEKIITSSSYFIVDVSNANYKKTGGNTASLDCYFTAYTVIGGNKLGVWGQYELDLVFLSPNHGTYIGKQLENPEDTNGKTVNGMFVYDSESGVGDFLQNSEEEQPSGSISSYLTDKVWVDVQSDYSRYLSFDSNMNYRHYFKYKNDVLEEAGKYVVDEKNSTLKLLDALGNVSFDFKVIKIGATGMELATYDVVNKQYPSTATITLRAAKADETIPPFLTETKMDLNISEPVIEEIGIYQATVKGTILGDNIKFQDRGVCYSTDTEPTIDDVCVSYNANVLNKTLTNLFSGTRYYVRLYAKVNDKYYYGNEVSFTTDGERIEKLVLKVVSETSNLVKSRIEMSAELPNEIGKYGLCYGKKPHPTITDNYVDEAHRKTSWTLTDIECGYDYYVRAYHIEGTKIIYYENSEVKISPVNKGQIRYEFKFDFSQSKNVPYFLSIKLSDLPTGFYSVSPVVWRYKDAYYKEHEGKNYDTPKKYVELGDKPASLEFSGSIACPESHQMYGENYTYHLDSFKIEPIENADAKTIRITFIDKDLN